MSATIPISQLPQSEDVIQQLISANQKTVHQILSYGIEEQSALVHVPYEVALDLRDAATVCLSSKPTNLWESLHTQDDGLYIPLFISPEEYVLEQEVWSRYTQYPCVINELVSNDEVILAVMQKNLLVNTCLPEEYGGKDVSCFVYHTGTVQISKQELEQILSNRIKKVKNVSVQEERHIINHCLSNMHFVQYSSETFVELLNSKSDDMFSQNVGLIVVLNIQGVVESMESLEKVKWLSEMAESLKTQSNILDIPIVACCVGDQFPISSLGGNKPAGGSLMHAVVNLGNMWNHAVTYRYHVYGGATVQKSTQYMVTCVKSSSFVLGSCVIEASPYGLVVQPYSFTVHEIISKDDITISSDDDTDVA